MTVEQAATSLNVSARTIRRRIKDGKLKATMVDGHYEVELPGMARQDDHLANQRLRQSDHVTRQDPYVNALLDRIKSLEGELESRRIEIQQLHALLSRPQLPGPSWWQRLFRRQG